MDPAQFNAHLPGRISFHRTERHPIVPDLYAQTLIGIRALSTPRSGIRPEREWVMAHFGIA